MNIITVCTVMVSWEDAGHFALQHDNRGLEEKKCGWWSLYCLKGVFLGRRRIGWCLSSWCSWIGPLGKLLKLRRSGEVSVVGNVYPETETFGIISYVNGGCFLAEEEDRCLNYIRAGSYFLYNMARSCGKWFEAAHVWSCIRRFNREVPEEGTRTVEKERSWKKIRQHGVLSDGGGSAAASSSSRHAGLAADTPRTAWTAEARRS